MKPTKNRIYCRDCGRFKMVFENEKKANTFIKFNGDEIEAASGFAPIRAYYCIVCGGWHVTSKEEVPGLKSPTEIRLEKYEEQKKNKELRLQQIQLEQANQKAELKKLLAKLNEHIFNIDNSIKYGFACPDLVGAALFDLEIAKKINVIFKGSAKKKTHIEEKINYLKEVVDNMLIPSNQIL